MSIFKWLKALGYGTIEAYEHCAIELLDSKRCYSFEDGPTRMLAVAGSATVEHHIASNAVTIAMRIF